MIINVKKSKIMIINKTELHSSTDKTFTHHSKVFEEALSSMMDLLYKAVCANKEFSTKIKVLVHNTDCSKASIYLETWTVLPKHKIN